MVHKVANVPEFGADFSPDGQRMRYCSPNSQINLLALPNSKVTHWSSGKNVGGPLFRPDGQQVMVVAPQSVLQVWGISERSLLKSIAHPRGYSGGAWHSGGRLIATGCDDRKLRIWDTGTGEQTWEITAFRGGGGICQFTPDCAHLVTNDRYGLLRLWEVHSVQQRFATPVN